ncbi:MAG: PAS domain S-box protein [Streptosporangiaceae bacterium]
MLTEIYPVRWTGRRAVITLPEHIDVSNAGQIREELLSVINRGAVALIADLTATVSCDHAGADAVVRAYHRAAVSGTELRLVVTAPIVRRVLSLTGLDRLVSVYPSLEAATPARQPATVSPLAAAGPEGPAPAITEAAIGELIDGLQDGVALADGHGALALANVRLEEMFGYAHAELIGRPVDSLVPASLRAAHRSHRAAYGRAPRARPMGAGARLVALRKDGTTFPVEISLSPVATATATFTLTVIRDVTEARRLADLARAAVTAQQAGDSQDLLDAITTSLCNVGRCLQAAADLPHEMASEGIADALQYLDDTIRRIHATTCPPRPADSPETVLSDGAAASQARDELTSQREAAGRRAGRRNSAVPPTPLDEGPVRRDVGPWRVLP